MRADPANAAAWLNWMDRQPGRRDQALAGLAQSQNYRLYWGAVTAAVLAALPAQATPLTQFALLLQSTVVDSGVGMPPMQTVIALCKPAAAADNATRAACAALAPAMAEHSDTLLGARIGLRVGDMVGWPATRVAALRADLDRLQAQAGQMIDPVQPWSCGTVLATRAWADAVGRGGEMAALRERAAAAAQPAR